MVSKFDPERPHAEFSDWLNRRMAAHQIASHKRAGTLAKLFSISPQGVRKWLNGKTLPETPRIALLADIYGDPADLDPILRRTPPEPRQTQDPQDAAYDPLAEDKRAMLEILDQLAPEQRATLRAVGSAFVEQGKMKLKDGST